MLIALSTDIAAQAPVDKVQQSLRDCVGNATTAAAIDQCETRWQTTLLQRIDDLNTAIIAQLDRRQRAAFDQNVQAWRRFVEHEIAMITLSTRSRADGLGTRLRSGAISRLYEQREHQLREHLHNLKTG